MSSAVTFYRAGMRELSDAAMLEILGRAGTAGIIVPDMADALQIGGHVARGGLRRLASAGFCMEPACDTRRGRPHRYTILPAGLALLQSRESVVLPAQQLVLIQHDAARGAGLSTTNTP